MMVIGLTGGIGSGKTTVAKMFKNLGVPVYIADDEAKKLMHSSEAIRERLTELFGEKAYVDNQLNREYIGGIVFKDKKLLAKLNEVVHPEVHRHFETWKLKQNTSFVIKEAAILFENGGYKFCDKVILVTAPLEDRISRVVQRDKTNRDAVLDRISNQWEDARKEALSDYIISNIDLESTALKVAEIYKLLSN